MKHSIKSLFGAIALVAPIFLFVFHFGKSRHLSFDFRLESVVVMDCRCNPRDSRSKSWLTKSYSASFSQIKINASTFLSKEQKGVGWREV